MPERAVLTHRAICWCGRMPCGAYSCEKLCSCKGSPGLLLLEKSNAPPSAWTCNTQTSCQSLLPKQGRNVPKNLQQECRTLISWKAGKLELFRD